MKINTDPRYSVINKRLAKAKNIIAVTGWKGGIGKSSVSCVLALLLAKQGCKTGLLDLDFTGASAHTVLGVTTQFPQEIEGLLPPKINGVEFMSASFFTQGKTALFRGSEITDAIVELLAVTNWGDLDFLILDMPPGVSDTALDCVRFIKQAKLLVVETPSVLSKSVSAAAKKLFEGMGVKAIGVIENMAAVSGAGDGYAARIKYDGNFEQAIGNGEKLVNTQFAKDLEPVTKMLKNINI